MGLSAASFNYLLAASAMALTVLLVVGLRASSVGPLEETFGRIYVESPEVYTRQRLVNDRYQQEWWLNRRLEVLDDATNLIEGFRSEVSSARIEVSLDQLLALATGRGGSDASGETARGRDAQTASGAGGRPQENGASDQTSVSFQTDFALRAAARDNLRQLLLENALDDRHDLTGNTVYGFKFDTVVIPGSNTTRSPAVIVELPPPPFADKSAADIISYATVPPVEADPVFKRVEQHYKNWLYNIEKRLNGFVEGVCNPRSGLSTEALGEFLEYTLYLTNNEANQTIDALGTNVPNMGGSESDGRLETVRLELPKQWQNNTVLNVHISDGMVTSFDVNTRLIQIYIIKNNTGIAGALNYVVKNEEGQASDAIRLWRTQSCASRADDAGSLNCDVSAGASADFHIYVPSSDYQAFTDTFSQAVSGLGAVVKDRPISSFEFEEGEFDGWAITVDAGLFRFLDRAQQVESYAYAAFPRGDVEGVVVDAFRSVDVDVTGPVNLGASETEHSGGIRAEPRLLNFAGGGTRQEHGTRKGFDFGWTIVRPGLQTPTLASQLVLVSVPAYSDRLSLTVTSGWLDRDYVRREAWTDLSLEERLDRLLDGADRMTMEVHLPPDYDAIDNMMLPGTSRLGPKIDELSLCEKELHIAADKPADIVIPGERLWRSTVVTLGGQKATKIQVLPDMRGIIATFDPLSEPIGSAVPGRSGEDAAATEWLAASGVAPESVPVPLSVWTSQGVDSLPSYVFVHPAGKEKSGADGESVSAETSGATER
ncbi:MAG TPA: hypothetical protein PKA33_06180 [Amaricoccus sp.]|uniref:hypothetical protein n=1 Tax=Amaricoccus sp. TaxID=1872485 RepID=UPI002C2D4541|nr:hypothetical protein [Amaricoccus sp.]HMQ92739.1 hypothetical protein [Amaricoccus sp.]HMR53713.1 hypothetical protein [Amaricoccus sp.]HMR59760.1 hypothetical protein [Amaricoccus sp.]HMT98946.1 hypothetical protein [Amaricoccus sp.]